MYNLYIFQSCILKDSNDKVVQRLLLRLVLKGFGEVLKKCIRKFRIYNKKIEIVKKIL